MAARRSLAVTRPLLVVGVAIGISLGVPQTAAGVAFGLTGAQGAPTIAEIDRVRRSGDLSRAETMARQALRVAPDGQRPDRLRFVLAVLLITQERGYNEAATLLEAVEESAMGLSDRRWLWLSRAYLGAGQREGALKAIAAYLPSDRSSDEAYELRLARARLIANSRTSSPGAGAVSELGPEPLKDATEALVSRKAPPYYRAEALRLRADAMRGPAKGDPEVAKALDAIERQLLVTFPSESATRRDGLALSPKALSRSERFKRGLNLMAAWDYEKARDTFEALRGEKYRSGAARWKIAEISIFKMRDDMERGREALSTWVRRKDARGREKATFWTMRAFVKEDRYDDARKLLTVLDEDFKGGEYQERVDFYSAWLWYDQGDCKKALPLMRLYMETHRKTASKMRVPFSWCLIRQKRWRRAYRALNRELRRDHPLHRGRALYWQAYVLDKMGRRDDALVRLDKLNARFPLSHYGMLGLQLRAAFEGRDQRASAQPWPSGGGLARWRLEPGVEAWRWPKLAPRQQARFQRIRELVAIGDVDRARREYERIRSAVEKRVPKSKRLRFQVFMGHQVEDHKIGWQRATGSSFSTKTGMPDPEDPDWMLAYPQAYRPLIERLGA